MAFPTARTFGKWQTAHNRTESISLRLQKQKHCTSTLCHPTSNASFQQTSFPWSTWRGKRVFANVTNSQKAIRERGWGPLNYCLLDHPDLNQKLDIQPSTENNGNNNQSTININTTGLLFQTYLDKIIDQEMKNQGHRLKYKEVKEENEHREVFISLKKSTTTSTSGSLVSHKQL